MRTKKAIYNSISKLLYEVVAAVSGLILPRLILSNFGSDYNGVIASISQFIGYTSLLTAGVGGVTQASLYKSLADHDTIKISGILRATEIFMQKVAIIFIFGLIGFASLYPVLVRDEFDWFFTFSLVLILGIGTFAQYFFGITFKTLLGADQREYIPTLISTLTTLINTAVAVALIHVGSEIRVIKLASALVFAGNPIFINIYVRKRYKIIHSIEPDNSAIKQRWDAFAHQIANFVNNNTDIIILTVFTGIMEVSVYSIYYLVINNIRTIITSLMGQGLAAAFGSMIAKNEHKNIHNSLRLYEFMSGSLSVLFFTCTAVLIVPFISVFTKGVKDADYFQPLFAYLACAAQCLYVLRLPYQSLVLAAGHFRQTRNGAIMEAAINIIVSLLLVQSLGLVGVTIGTLCAMVFRTVQYALYMSRHIVLRSIRIVVRKLLLYAFHACAIIVLAQLLPKMNETTYIAWILYALPVFGVATGVTALLAVLFYRKEIQMLTRNIRHAFQRKETK